MEFELDGTWEPVDGVEEAVGAYLRVTGAPFLLRLHPYNNDKASSESTKIALAFEKGSAPMLKLLTLDYVMQSNSKSILTDAVAQNGRFVGLRHPKITIEDGNFDPAPLFQAIAAGHKRPLHESFDVWTEARSIMALGNAFAAGAFPAVTDLHTPALDLEQAEGVIAFIRVLEARATPMLQLELRDIDLPAAVFQVLADAQLLRHIARIDCVAFVARSF